MNRSTACALTAVALIGVAAPAAAQDAATFAGPRVEAQVGWERMDFDLGDYGVEDDTQESGITYGASVGYDVALGTNLVAGVEATLSYSSTDGAFADGNALGYTFETGRELAVAGRLGVPVGSNALVYGKAGYTNLRVSAVSDDATTSTRTDLDGFQAGVGTEIALTPSTYVKGEYNYSDYEDDISRHRILTGIGIRF